MNYTSLGLLLLITGCSGSTGSGSFDEIPLPEGLGGAEPTGEVSFIQEIDWNCDADGWDYTALTDGGANVLRLQIVKTGDWDGTEEAPPRDAEEGVWRESFTFFSTGEGTWSKSLLYNDNAAQVANSSSETNFLCGRDTAANVAYSFQVLDSNELVYDCALWGHNSEAWFSDNWGLADECLCFEPEEEGACGDHSALE